MLGLGWVFYSLWQFGAAWEVCCFAPAISSLRITTPVLRPQNPLSFSPVYVINESGAVNRAAHHPYSAFRPILLVWEPDGYIGLEFAMRTADERRWNEILRWTHKTTPVETPASEAHQSQLKSAPNSRYVWYCSSDVGRFSGVSLLDRRRSVTVSFTSFKRRSASVSFSRSGSAASPVVSIHVARHFGQRIVAVRSLGATIFRWHSGQLMTVPVAWLQ